MGIPAGELPFVLTPYVSNKTESLPAILKDHGYNTSFFHGAPNGSMGFKALVNLIGIDHYYGKDEYDHDDDFDGTWGIWDEPFFQYFAHTVNEFKEPFMTTIFSVSSHEPFEVPSAYRGRFPKGDHPLREAIGYTDMSLRKFFDTAKKMPWFNHTLFIITGDHPSHSTNEYFYAPLGKYEVPLLVYAPNLLAPKKIDSMSVSHCDIFPSIMHLTGSKDKFFAMGKSIFEDGAKSVINQDVGITQLITYPYCVRLMPSGNTKMMYQEKYTTNKQIRYKFTEAELLLQQQLEKELRAKKQIFTNSLLENTYFVE